MIWGIYVRRKPESGHTYENLLSWIINLYFLFQTLVLPLAFRTSNLIKLTWIQFPVVWHVFLDSSQLLNYDLSYFQDVRLVIRSLDDLVSRSNEWKITFDLRILSHCCKNFYLWCSFDTTRSYWRRWFQFRSALLWHVNKYLHTNSVGRPTWNSTQQHDLFLLTTVISR